MTVRKKVIGRQPTDHGAYVPGQSYGNKYQVELYGCVWESKHDNNNTAPATFDGYKITENTIDWKKVSGSTEAWILGADKPATTGSTGDYPYNGMGKVTLPKNMVNVGTEQEPVYENQLTQDMFYKGPAGSRVPNTNTIFVVQFDYTLAENVTIPTNCVLKFEGGSIRGNGTGKELLAGNPKIDAPEYQIFYNLGTDLRKVKAEWIGVLAMGDKDVTSSNLQTFLNKHVAYDSNYGNRVQIVFSFAYLYNFGSGITIPAGLLVQFLGTTIGEYQSTFAVRFTEGTFIKILGQASVKQMDFTVPGNQSSTVNYINYIGSEEQNPPEGVNDVDAQIYNCTFSWGGTCVRLTGRQSTIKECNFVNSDIGVLIEDLLTTGNYGAGRNNKVIRCSFHGGMNVCIKCTGTNQRHLTISDNIRDVGSGIFFEGHLMSGFICNNNVHYAGVGTSDNIESIIKLYSCQDSFITGNKFDYANDLPNGLNPSILPNKLQHYITSTQQVARTSINNNMFGNCLGAGFVFSSLEFVTINCNSFHNVGGVLIDSNSALFCAAYNSFREGVPRVSTGNFDIINNSGEALSYNGVWNTRSNPVITTAEVGGSKYVKIGIITSSTVCGGAFIVAGTRNKNGQTLLYLNIKRESGDTPVVTCECLSSDNQYGTVYIDENDNIYYKNDYVYGGIISIQTFGAGVGIIHPAELTNEEVSELTLTDITLRKKGTTAQRPPITNLMYFQTYDGFCYYDITLHKPIYFKVTDHGGGVEPRYTTEWVDATGATV